MLKYYKDFINEKINSDIYYHGSKKHISQQDLKDGVMYFSKDYEFAKSYSAEKYKQKKTIVMQANLDLGNKILLDTQDDILITIADKLGLDFEDYAQAEFIEQEGVVKELKKLGYTAAILWDFSFKNDFDEDLVYIVFNAKKQVKMLK